MAADRESWNARLVQALRDHQAQALAEGKKTWWMFKKATDEVEAVKKDIWINLTLSAIFGGRKEEGRASRDHIIFICSICSKRALLCCTRGFHR